MWLSLTAMGRCTPVAPSPLAYTHLIKSCPPAFPLTSKRVTLTTVPFVSEVIARLITNHLGAEDDPMPLDKSSARVRQMFGEIAGRYDLLNRLLSLGIDRSWRRRTVKLVPPEGDAPILDVCTGTADLALAYWRARPRRVPVVGTDFCPPMLAIGRRKCRRAGAEAGKSRSWRPTPAAALSRRHVSDRLRWPSGCGT